jgi:hypothetical protein
MRNAKFLGCNQHVNNTIVNETKWNFSGFHSIPRNYKPLVTHDYGAMDGLKRTISFAFTLNYNFQETAVIWK